VTDVPGLYFLGLTWQHTRGSALVGWVKDDAQFIAERIAAYREGHGESGRTRPKEEQAEQRASTGASTKELSDVEAHR
jgi:putative flavoprotein involved in K+ transport